ncbi:NAD(P)/FAD-dependent oxidoreductase [Nocardiopsis sp. MG754419]|uniref:FAD-dependent oxidoreductase n=1 Tax=Nocardiopsis sp. MG754419 TaxID=2259865 RepID=UPI001BA77FB6|nr:NAD(P)/FAD-dependent oxidoreductase [Nocardiopsis sp. MG754419]MBR8744905.1 FAD-dependent monooxygenase [Nocardiopsis sp. MG754419]
MRVVVIGAGVGGLALARGLTDLGHEVEVHERASAPRTDGAGLGLYPNGVAALAGVGVDVSGIGRRLDGLENRDPSGRVRYTLDVDAVRERYGFEARVVPRRDLLALLSDGLPDRTVRYGRVCTRVRVNPDGSVSALFGDGTSATGDVVVGADGVRSAARRDLWDGDPARPTGWASWQAMTEVPMEAATGTVGAVVQGRQGRCGILPAGDGLVQWWFDVRWRPEIPRPESPMDVLRKLFGDWSDPWVRAVLDHEAEEAPAFFEHVRHRVPREWGVGGATLLGDAAHTFPHSTAQGADQALEDAWALTRVLAEDAVERDPARALRRYEQSRRGPVTLATGAEAIMRFGPPRLLGRERTSALATRQYIGYLGGVSNVLTDRRP